MLKLKRRAGQTINIGDGIILTFTEFNGASVLVGIDAPRSVTVLRGELLERDSAKKEQP